MMTRLTFYKGKVTACLILLCLFLLQACQKEMLTPTANGIQNSLSIADAKNYFNEHIKSTKHSHRIMSTRAQQGTPTNDQLLENMLDGRQPIWESAYQSLLSTGAAVKIPINVGNIFMVTDEIKKEVVPFGALNYLFMYRDSLQHIHSEWVTLLPDRDWLYGNRSQYTGHIQVKTWDGTLIKQFYYPKSGIAPKRYTSSSLKEKGALKKTSNDSPGQEIPLANIVCLSFANSSKCTCIDKSNCDMCWECTSNVCRTEPAAYLIPEFNGPTIGSGGGSGSPGGFTGGGGPSYPEYTPPNCVSDPNYVMPSYPAPGGADWMMPCDGPGGIPMPTEPIVSATPLSIIINFMGISDPAKQNYLLENIQVYDALKEFLVENVNTSGNMEFVNWAAEYLMENPTISIATFKNQFMPTDAIIADPDETNWTDPDNEILDDLDQTVYQQYQDNQPWAAVNQVIKFEDFVPNRYLPGSTTQTVNCLKLAKEQLAKKGYTVSGYYVGSPQIYQAYTETGGVNVAKTREAISYTIETLKKGIPVLVGVDVIAGAPSANKDNSTDHFIVIIGAGTDGSGKYFQFMDSSTNWPTLGASKNNKLYFDPLTGKITGKTMSQYGSRSNRHDFILTHVRKSIKK